MRWQDGLPRLSRVSQLIASRALGPRMAAWVLALWALWALWVWFERSCPHCTEAKPDTLGRGRGRGGVLPPTPSPLLVPLGSQGTAGSLGVCVAGVGLWVPWPPNGV